MQNEMKNHDSLERTKAESSTRSITLPSPIIHRLPSELLVEIFALCWSAFTPLFDECEDDSSSSLEVEMPRLAHEPLLAVSQVCSRWHAITMGTPALWTSIELDSVLWSTPKSTEMTMTLLQSALDRGRNSLLNLAVVIEQSAGQGPALELLAAHSERWKTATIICEPSDLQHLSAVKGRLPCLETLGLWGQLSRVDIFADAPRLNKLEFGGTPDIVAELALLPLRQLHEFSCEESLGLAGLMGVPTSECPSLNLMPLMSDAAKFILQLSLMEDSMAFTQATSLPPITSHLSGFSIDVQEGFVPATVGPTIAKIVECLTLPALQEFEIESEEYPHFPLPWAHAEFLGLSARSAFHTHLRTLRLYHSVISEPQLLECLSELPALEQLAISDHQLVPPYGGAAEHLITDTLLTALAQTSLVPRLRSFECQSMLLFDDAVYLEFLLSRVQDEQPFDIEIYWLPGHHRDFDARVVARIEELNLENKLGFLFTATAGA
ncbi:hypothetical protein C8R44DRAFT_974394 [Mycena epipterygia]|nr:hypothetical protein C8R44DRAFT_974394 [Mycena epipterygia]